MDLRDKGFLDERDNYRYVLSSFNYSQDELDNFVYHIIFNIYNDKTLNKINEYVVIVSGDVAEELYYNFNDLRDIYQKCVDSLGIEKELPKSMDGEIDG